MPLQSRRSSVTAWHWGALLFSLIMLAPSADAADEMTGAQAVICSRLAAEKVPPFDTQDRETVGVFYTARQCRPVWVDEHGRTRAARLAVTELGHAAEWGLNASEFKLKAVNRPLTSGRWVERADGGCRVRDHRRNSALRAPGSGWRIPEPEKLLSSYLDRQPVVTSAADVLSQVSEVADPGEVLRSYQPHQDQFLKLKALLADLRGREGVADAFQISKRGPMLQLASRTPDVALLKRRFSIAAEPGAEQVFDRPLADAVKKFQQSVELRGDGIVGPSTRAALSGHVSDKVTAIIANMEEWRWIPRSLGATHIFVNVPAFSIALTDKEKPVFEDRVIVGTPSTQTPIFSKGMTTIVLRPEWYLPDSIKLSKLLSGRSLESQGYVIKRNGRTVSSSRINWAKADLSAYKIYQPSGDDNALGLVKLLFPNKHSVYLHDTPSKSLFNVPVRLFSHGCMRVRNPQVLAQWIFDIDRGDAAPMSNGSSAKAR